MLFQDTENVSKHKFVLFFLTSRSVAQRRIQATSEFTDSSVTVSYLEIYNEVISSNVDLRTSEKEKTR